METNNQNPISPGAAIGKTVGLAATAIVFAGAVFLAVFLFTGSAGAQNFSQFAVPHAVCQEYRGQTGYSIVRDLTNDCLVRSGNSQTGFVYVHAYNSGNNFCVEMTSSQGRIFGPQCVPISGQCIMIWLIPLPVLRKCPAPITNKKSEAAGLAPALASQGGLRVILN